MSVLIDSLLMCAFVAATVLVASVFLVLKEAPSLGVPTAAASCILCIGLMVCFFQVNAYAGDRAAQLINSFQVMCLLEPLNFARSAEKATAMKLQVQQDLGKPADAAGNFAHAKSWLLPLSSGPHEFVVSEAHGPKGDFKTCGITSADVEAADFRAELVKTMKLGKPTAEATSADGVYRNTVWSIDELSLVLSDGSPKNLSKGVHLLVSNKPLAR